DACTVGDTCQSGRCESGGPVICAALDPCHGIGVCDSATGICSNPNPPNGSYCTDNYACTVADNCQSGRCQSGAPVICTALDQCHVTGTCVPTTGICSNPALPPYTSLFRSDACTVGDTCQSGRCESGGPVICAALDPCHGIGVCDSATG